jgi:hypothetical protein
MTDSIEERLRAENERQRAEIDELKRVLALVSKAGRADNEDNERLRAFLQEIADVAAEFTGVPDIARRALKGS